MTRCEMTTYEPDELMDLAFEDEHKVQKMIMKVRNLSNSDSASRFRSCRRGR